MIVDLATVRALPKVVLHDHLDGGLRPATIVELAAPAGHTLPTTDAEELGRWFLEAATSGSLPRYLETFEHTTAVMQTADGLRRVAREAAVDLAADGVVYAEQRYAPEQHLHGGLSLQQVVDAVQQGFDEGVAEAASAGRFIRVGTLITAMRQAGASRQIAELAVANRERGVVGFDIAGPEDGFPPSLHADAFDHLHEELLPATVHAGEAAGLDSIREAVLVGHAQRLGHGVRIVEDIELSDVAGGPAVLGRLAGWVRDRRIALELCPTSNVQTGAAASVATHPVTVLKQLGFAVTVNTDNRLQSGTSVSREYLHLLDEAGWSLDDVRQTTLTAANAAFLPWDERQEIVERQIRPAYDRAAAVADPEETH